MLLQDIYYIKFIIIYFYPLIGNRYQYFLTYYLSNTSLLGWPSQQELGGEETSFGNGNTLPPMTDSQFTLAPE